MRQLESFFWGIIAALGALFFQLVFYLVFLFYADTTNPNLSFSSLFALPIFIIVGAVMEEIFKYLVIAKRLELYSQNITYLINSFLVGLGFFATELILVYSSTSNIRLQAIAEIALIHIGSAGLIGYIIAIKNPAKISTFLFAIILATFFHAAYNLLLLERTYFPNLAIFGILLFLIAFNFLNLLRIRSKLAQN